MSLTTGEQRTLAEIASKLRRSDPELAATCTILSPAVPREVVAASTMHAKSSRVG